MTLFGSYDVEKSHSKCDSILRNNRRSFQLGNMKSDFQHLIALQFSIHKINNTIRTQWHKSVVRENNVSPIIVFDELF